MRVSGSVKTGIFVAAVAVALFQIALLGVGVGQQIDRLSKANSGDGLWHLSQLEVDYRRLTTALAAADDPSGYGEIRHRFDVFFSRVLTLTEGESYQRFRDQPEFAVNLTEVMAYLTGAIPYIDGDDAKLSQDLEMLRESTDAINAPVRQMAVAAVTNSSQRNEELRGDMRDVLMRLVLTTAALIVGLILSVIFLRRLYNQARDASEENKLSRARIASMIHASLDAILVTDPQGNLLEMNRAAERMFQTKLPNFEKIHLSTLVKGTAYDGAYTNPALSGLLARGRIQTQALRRNGTAFPVEISLVQAKLEERSDIYVAYVRDISVRLKAEDNLRQARDEAQAGEKAKARLLAVMSHEIRTPLNGVLGAADLLSSSQLDTDQKRYVDAMKTSGGILERHINDVLELSRLDDSSQPRDLAPIALHQLVPEVVNSQRAFAEQSETTLDARVTTTVPASVMGDRLGIQQALLNLVGNAIKFSAGGSVSVEADHFGEGDMIEFRVIDDGIGISEEEVEKVFEDFYASDTSFARRKQGTGLGLGITKRIVAAMGGEIGAESIPGEGSMFWFRLPMEPTSEGTTVEIDTSPIVQTDSPSKILLVEDNAINRMIATDMLQNAGHSVTQAENGASGVAAAKSESFDLILMDISMPDMDGLTAAEHIRHSDGQSKDTPIVALTAQAMGSDTDRLKRHGIQHVLQKPLTSQMLNGALDALLSGSEAAGPVKASNAQDEILDTAILEDLLKNLGPNKAQSHFRNLQSEIEAQILVSNKGTYGLKLDAQTAHYLAGASAVLGLCAFHKRLTETENNGGTDGPDADMHSEWKLAEAAFTEYLADFFH